MPVCEDKIKLNMLRMMFHQIRKSIAKYACILNGKVNGFYRDFCFFFKRGFFRWKCYGWHKTSCDHQKRCLNEIFAPKFPKPWPSSVGLCVYNSVLWTLKWNGFFSWNDTFKTGLIELIADFIVSIVATIFLFGFIFKPYTSLKLEHAMRAACLICLDPVKVKPQNETYTHKNTDERID